MPEKKLPALKEKVKPDEHEEEVDPEESSEDKHKRQQEERQREWGFQFDRWLIKAAQNERTLLLTLVHLIPGAVLEDGMIMVRAVPKRVDKYFIQVSLSDGAEVWIDKAWITSCQITTKSRGSEIELPD